MLYSLQFGTSSKNVIAPMAISLWALSSRSFSIFLGATFLEILNQAQAYETIYSDRQTIHCPKGRYGSLAKVGIYILP
jgi:hypothetical protein